MKEKIVITFGTFDLFHIGHLRILESAAKLGDKLIVGISTDELTFAKKGRYPVCPQDQRKKIIDCINYVSESFYEESLELKKEYLLNYKADILVMGDDWRGKFDHLEDICEIVYLPRTASISTTEIIEKIKLA